MSKAEERALKAYPIKHDYIYQHTTKQRKT